MPDTSGPGPDVDVVVVGEQCIARQKALAEIDSAMPIEVHGKKCQVDRHIAVSKAIVELDAIEDHDLTGDEVAVFEPQVTMAVADAP